MPDFFADDEDATELLAGCVVDGGAVVDALGEGEPVPPADFDPPSFEVRAWTVTTSSTRTSTIEPVRMRRRRQYTEGGWDPTGRSMATPR